MDDIVNGLNPEARAYAQGYDAGRKRIPLSLLPVEQIEHRRAWQMGYDDAVAGAKPIREAS